MRGILRKSIQAASRGCSPQDKLLIAFVLLVVIPGRGLLKRHPRILRFLSNVTNCDICVKTATPNGLARIIFNPSQDCELVVVRELLAHQLYLVKSDHDAVIDIGAFRGISTIYLADQVGTNCIIAIEPNSENFAILTRRLSTHLPIARAEKVALGARGGMSGFVGSGVSGRLSDAGSRIEVVTFSEIVPKNHLHSPLIKMDIEGAEEDVLPQLLPELPKHCALFVETHRGFDEAERLLKPYETAGFRISRCSDTKEHSSEEIYIDWMLER